MRSFIGYFVGNRTAVVLFTLVISVFGIRAYQSLPHEAAPDLKIPVVLVTSKSGDSDKFWGQKQGADMHIGKPFGDGEIQEAIKRYVR